MTLDDLEWLFFSFCVYIVLFNFISLCLDYI